MACSKPKKKTFEDQEAPSMEIYSGCWNELLPSSCLETELASSSMSGTNTCLYTNHVFCWTVPLFHFQCAIVRSSKRSRKQVERTVLEIRQHMHQIKPKVSIRSFQTWQTKFQYCYSKKLLVRGNLLYNTII